MGDPSRKGALRFGAFLLDLPTRELTRDGVKVRIRSKPLEVLVYLAEQEGRVVSREELLARVWPGVTVSPEAVTSALRDLRRAVGDAVSPHRVVVTVRARGYKLERYAEASPMVDRDAVLQAAEALLARLQAQTRECETLLRRLQSGGRLPAPEGAVYSRRDAPGARH